MRKRLTVLVASAVMLAMMVASAGMVQAQPVAGAADAKCLNLARQTLGGFGADINPSNTTFVGGTEGRDVFTGKGTEGRDVFTGKGTEGRDVFCGFGGDNDIKPLDEGDVFLGGADRDTVFDNYGTFYGGEGNDLVYFINYGTVYGGEGNDRVFYNRGTFYGGAGDDAVPSTNSGTFED